MWVVLIEVMILAKSLSHSTRTLHSVQHPFVQGGGIFGPPETSLACEFVLNFVPFRYGYTVTVVHILCVCVCVCV